MMKFKMTCTCGDVMEVEAANREEAIVKLKGIMNDEMVAKHMAEKHSGQPVPSMDQIGMMIIQGLQPAA